MIKVVVQLVHVYVMKDMKLLQEETLHVFVIVKVIVKQKAVMKGGKTK